jgi:putative ABC transport system substrate-binding protein
LATELVRLNVDILLGIGGDIALAFKKATSTDPVRSQLVSSLARPGGNLTGVSFVFDELAAKRVELLREVMPRLSRLGVLWDPSHVDNDFTEVRGAARGLPLQSLEVRGPDDLDMAFQAAMQVRIEALIVVPGRLTAFLSKRITDFAAQHGCRDFWMDEIRRGRCRPHVRAEPCGGRQAPCSVRR